MLLFSGVLQVAKPGFNKDAGISWFLKRNTGTNRNRDAQAYVSLHAGIQLQTHVSIRPHVLKGERSFRKAASADWILLQEQLIVLIITYMPKCTGFSLDICIND